MSNGSELYQRTKEQVPVKWYEGHLSAVPFVVAIVALGVAADFNKYGERLSWASVTALLIIIGTLADQYTTERVAVLVNQLKDDYDIDVPLTESALILPDKPTVPDLYKPKVLWQDGSLLVFGVLLPQVGIPIAILKSLDGLSNWQKIERLELALEWAKAGQTDTSTESETE